MKDKNNATNEDKDFLERVKLRLEILRVFKAKELTFLTFHTLLDDRAVVGGASRAHLCELFLDNYSFTLISAVFDGEVHGFPTGHIMRFSKSARGSIIPAIGRITNAKKPLSSLALTNYSLGFDP